jgi:dTDP-4-dehydrorhamnose reductase
MIGNYKEIDRVQSINFYALTKFLGEVEVEANSKKHLIIRTSFKPNTSWPFARAFNDVWTSADYVDVIAKKISFLVVNGASGTYNVGTERKTIYDLAKSRNPTVGTMSREEIKKVFLPHDCSMNTEKYEAFVKEIENVKSCGCK